MLFDEPARVVAELQRVLVPGGVFAAMLGGGPTATGTDTFHRWLALAAPHLDGPAFGDPRARSEAGWQALFAGWSVTAFERIEHDLSGSFADVWALLGASYQLPARAASEVRAALHAELGDDDVPLRVVTYLAVARAPGA